MHSGHSGSIRSTGFRRLTVGLLKADDMAEGFAGLPGGVTSPVQLLSALKAAAAMLGISPRLVHAVDWLFGFTQPQDWEEGARPIVWPSALLQQRELGLSPTQVKEINRRLIELGLITMRDSPNGKRYGQRDPKGRIVEAYGFDLAPMAARYSEFRRAAEAAKAERIAMGRLRRRATIARKGIAQILETVREYGFGDESWQTLARETGDVVRALKVVERVDEMEIGAQSLERRQRAALERLRTLLLGVQTDPKGPENRPHNTTTTEPLYPSEYVIARRESSLPAAPSEPMRATPEPELPVRANELPELAPKLKPYLNRPDPTWRDIVDAADGLGRDLGISKSLWGEACIAMGRELAAVAVAIVSTKESEHFTSSPGGYFRGMVAKHVAGDLHLDRTIWKLRNRKTDRQP